MSAMARYFTGLGCVVGYIVIASTQSVALSSWLATTNVFLVTGLSFVVVLLLFVTVALRTGRTDAYRFVLSHPRLLLALNVAGTFNWLFYFLAVKYLPPAVAVTLTQGIGPVSMSAYKLWRHEPVSRVTRTCHAAILAVAAVMCLYVIDHRVTNGSYGRGALVAATVIAVVCSVSITATLVLSRTFAEASTPASVVLSIRFLLLITVCLAVLPTQQHLELDARTLGIVVTVGLVGVGGGAYLLQRGVELAPSLAVSTCLALSPLVVFGIGAVHSAAGSDLVEFVLIGLIVVVSLVSLVYDGTRLRSAAAVSGRPQVVPGPGPEQ
jgi:drug/metabolite transporter (DMT)-like permease